MNFNNNVFDEDKENNNLVLEAKAMKFNKYLKITAKKSNFGKAVQNTKLLFE